MCKRRPPHRISVRAKDDTGSERHEKTRKHFLGRNVTPASNCLSSLQDYCNHLFGCPLYILSGLQTVQNVAQKLVFKGCRRDHLKPFLHAPLLRPVQTDYSTNYQLSVATYSLTHHLYNLFGFGFMFVWGIVSWPGLGKVPCMMGGGRCAFKIQLLTN